MFTVEVSNNDYIATTTAETLKDAIKEKYALEVNRLDLVQASIFDADGYLVSTRTMKLYIIQNLV